VKNSLNSNEAKAYYSLAKFDTRLSQKNAFLKKGMSSKGDDSMKFISKHFGTCIKHGYCIGVFAVRTSHEYIETTMS